MSFPNLSSSSTRTLKNTNPDLKHENTCPDFLAFFLPFLVNQTQTQINFQQEYKHKPSSRSSQIFSNHKTQIYKISTQTQIFSSFNQQRNLQQIKFITQKPNSKTQKIKHKNTTKKNYKFQSPHPQTQAKSFLSSFSFFVWLPRKWKKKNLDNTMKVHSISLLFRLHSLSKQKHKHLNYKKNLTMEKPTTSSTCQRVNSSRSAISTAI